MDETEDELGEDLPEVADLTSDAALASADQSALPMLIGDAPGFGGCGSLDISGIDAVIGHPNFGCSRLNLADNGTPFLRNRFFVQYHHFENPTGTEFFDPAFSAEIDIDRYTVGFERIMPNGWMSVELRVPFNYQLTSDINVIDINGAYTNVPLSNRDFNLGNIGVAAKFLMHQTCTTVVTSGAGLSLPTAPDVNIDARIDDTDLGGTGVDVDQIVDAVVPNEVVFLTPFVAAAYNPGGLLFTQGFAQLDVPLNKQTGSLVATPGPRFGNPGVEAVDAAGERSISYQTLLRLNGQLGYWIYQDPCCCSWLRAAAALVEIHYTTTLTDADVETIDLGDIAGQDVILSLGNQDNRVDILNATWGGSFYTSMGRFQAGFVTPLSYGCNCQKPFDWEVNASWNYEY